MGDEVQGSAVAPSPGPASAVAPTRLAGWGCRVAVVRSRAERLPGGAGSRVDRRATLPLHGDALHSAGPRAAGTDLVRRRARSGRSGGGAHNASRILSKQVEQLCGQPLVATNLSASELPGTAAAWLPLLPSTRPGCAASNSAKVDPTPIPSGVFVPFGADEHDALLGRDEHAGIGSCDAEADRFTRTCPEPFGCLLGVSRAGVLIGRDRPSMHGNRRRRPTS